jgi:hypothetical protein
MGPPSYHRAGSRVEPGPPAGLLGLADRHLDFRDTTQP